MLRRARERFRGGWGGGGGPREGAPRRGIPSFGLIAALVFAGWLASGIFIVDAGEQGLVTRFGAYQGPPRGPGLHYHLPAPFEAAQVVGVTTQRRMEIMARENQDDSLMITGDRNIVDIDFAVLYLLNNSAAYVFNVRDQEEVIRAIAESAIREVVGQRELEAIITVERAAVEQSVQTLMQRTLNEYQMGVRILGVQLLRSQAPADVREAFDDVIAARSDRQAQINQAETYRNEVVPRARGEAAQQIQQAEGYREQVVREANGEAARFLSVYQEYRRSPRVTRQRLYLETMERIYRGADRMIIDGRSGAVPYLPLDQLRRSNTQNQQPPAQAPAPPQ
ncbi:MAG: FtsH protease activity modulator HflK [Hyphomonadaceae bacterium]